MFRDEKISLMIIGRSESPRPFQKKYGWELGFAYHFKRNSWMNQGLFFVWFHLFDQYIRRTPGRKALLLVNYGSVYGGVHSLSTLQKSCLELLPTMTTKKIQPLDTVIKTWVQNKYSCRLLNHIFENIESWSKLIYNADILTAMR